MRIIIRVIFLILAWAAMTASITVIGAALMIMAGWQPGPQILIMITGIGAIAATLMLRRRRRSPAARARDKIPAGGHEFEHWVARRLRDEGWNARVTQASGDQGIDIVASLGRTSVGIQCKRYNRSVGNKAVQEALAGRIFHGLDVAAVISTAPYTKSARALASKTGVHLLAVEDIRRMRRLAAR